MTKITRPREFFRPDEEATWRPVLKQLSELNLPAKSIADHFGCSHTTLVHSDDAMEIVRKGWAFYRAFVEMELWLAISEPLPNDLTHTERLDWKRYKADIAKHIHKHLTKDPWVAPVEQERLSRLTDEELEVELGKASTQIQNRRAS